MLRASAAIENKWDVTVVKITLLEGLECGSIVI